MKSPNHIAIIMDGNGRWGLKNHKSRLIGHEFGVKNIKNIINYCLKHKINFVTLFALSSDNLKKRSKREIENLFALLENYLKKNIHFFKEKKIKLNFIGENVNLPKKINVILKKYSNETKLLKSKLILNIALNYSSKQEIVNSCKLIAISQKQINQKNISKHLYTSVTKDPEILIRTGGHTRLSDFLLWQCSYTEIFFIKKLWPDFKPKDLDFIIKKFKKLKRNFGS
ncbi:polyprenyl diphosphate synthase [Pelagibacteraceae bacterium]|nr:polyprenyl diphosphate synthase [Pelagibacteraceae bacterium]